MYITTIPPAPPAKTYPVYYLGRPVAVYQRRYLRREKSSGQLG